MGTVEITDVTDGIIIRVGKILKNSRNKLPDEIVDILLSISENPTSISEYRSLMYNKLQIMPKSDKKNEALDVYNTLDYYERRLQEQTRKVEQQRKKIRGGKKAPFNDDGTTQTKLDI